MQVFAIIEILLIYQVY